MRGRKPIPSNVHALRGNPGRRPLKENYLKPSAAIPQCPDFLSPIARAEWQRITEQLSVLGLVSELDRAALAAYCVAYGRWVEAEEQLRQFGPIYKSPRSYLQIAKDRPADTEPFSAGRQQRDGADVQAAGRVRDDALEQDENQHRCRNSRRPRPGIALLQRLILLRRPTSGRDPRPAIRTCLR